MAALADADGDGVADADGDGVADAADACPSGAGLPPDGCPPRDRDGDGTVDRADRCPDRAGPMANAGCPDADTDGDRVVDRLDRCDQEMGHPRFDGCPVPDADTDGVADPRDACPDEREVWNGRTDADGCPDRGAGRLAPGAQAVRFEPALRFRDGDRRLRRGDAEAVRLAAVLLEGMLARRVVIEVVADDGLSYGDSIQRARRRAAAVRGALLDALDLPPEAIIAEPMGPDGRPRVVVRYR